MSVVFRGEIRKKPYATVRLASGFVSAMLSLSAYFVPVPALGLIPAAPDVLDRGEAQNGLARGPTPLNIYTFQTTGPRGPCSMRVADWDFAHRRWVQCRRMGCLLPAYACRTQAVRPRGSGWRVDSLGQHRAGLRLDTPLPLRGHCIGCCQRPHTL